MSGYIPGVAFIVNHSESREGSEHDVENLRRTLEPLNVTVIVLSESEGPGTAAPQPLTSGYIAAKMKELKSDEWRKKFQHYQYVIVAHFSHGSTDERVQCDKSIISIQKVLLNPLFKIPELDGKLKWLIIQACRGPRDYKQPKTDGDVPNYFTKFFLKSFSSQEGGKSYRRDDYGSVYIEQLCAQLSRSAGEKGLLEILQDTSEAVKNFYTQAGLHLDPGAVLTQEPTVAYNFPGDFYFKHGFRHDNQME